MTKVEPIELYRQAMQQLQTAVDEIDQAHATLKDIHLQNAFYDGRNSLSIRKLYDDAAALLKALKEVTCDMCDKPVSENCQCWRPQ